MSRTGWMTQKIVAKTSFVDNSTEIACNRSIYCGVAWCGISIAGASVAVLSKFRLGVVILFWKLDGHPRDLGVSEFGWPSRSNWMTRMTKSDHWKPILKETRLLRQILLARTSLEQLKKILHLWFFWNCEIFKCVIWINTNFFVQVRRIFEFWTRRTSRYLFRGCPLTRIGSSAWQHAFSHRYAQDVTSKDPRHWAHFTSSMTRLARFHSSMLLRRSLYLTWNFSNLRFAILASSRTGPTFFNSERQITNVTRIQNCEFRRHVQNRSIWECFRAVLTSYTKQSCNITFRTLKHGLQRKL